MRCWGVTFDETTERLVGLFDVLGRALVGILAEPALENARLVVEIGEALDVQGIVHARMNRVFAHKGVGRFDSEFRRAALVIRVHQVQLDLPCDVAERIAGLDCLQNLDAAAVVAIPDRRLRLLVGLLQVLRRIERLIIARTGRQYRERREQHRPSGLPLQARRNSRHRHSKGIDHVFAGRTKSASIP
jgi:hypothetical protein